MWILGLKGLTGFYCIELLCVTMMHIVCRDNDWKSVNVLLFLPIYHVLFFLGPQCSIEQCYCEEKLNVDHSLFLFSQDCYEIVQKTTLIILERLQQVLMIDVSLPVTDDSLFSSSTSWSFFFIII